MLLYHFGGGTYRSRRSRSPQWRRHTPQTINGSTVRRAFCKTFSLAVSVPFRAQARGLLPKTTAVNGDDSGVPAAVDIRRRTVRMVWTGLTGSDRLWTNNRHGRGTDGLGGECLLAADGATGLDRGSGSRIRYIGARAPPPTAWVTAPAGRRAPSLFMDENRKTINSNLPAGSKKKRDKFLFAHRGPPVSVSLPAAVVSRHLLNFVVSVSTRAHRRLPSPGCLPVRQTNVAYVTASHVLSQTHTQFYMYKWSLTKRLSHLSAVEPKDRYWPNFFSPGVTEKSYPRIILPEKGGKIFLETFYPPPFPFSSEIFLEISYRKGGKIFPGKSYPLGYIVYWLK